MEFHNKNNLLYEIALSRLEGVGNVLFKNLINHFGSAENALNTPSAKLLKIPGVGDQLIKAFRTKNEALKEAEKIILESEKLGVRILDLRSDEYPEMLKQIFDSPPILYTKGLGKFKLQRTIAIVGSRDGTEYGKSVIDHLANELKDMQIISGMAYGIDIAAHKAALKHNHSTIGVLANGLETVYPKSHTKIATEIVEQGLLVSEQPVFAKLHPTFFIARNRIIAALSEVILIVESRKKGGSMVTAEFANNYNKEVFAVPGDVNRKLSEGPNSLIFNNKAQIYTDPETLIQWMNWNMEQKPSKPKITLDLSIFNEEESKVLQLLTEKGEMLIDDLGWHSQIHLNRLSSILLNLEFQDIVKQSPGKKFSIRN
jgi:DNA processing protein